MRREMRDFTRRARVWRCEGDERGNPSLTRRVGMGMLRIGDRESDGERGIGEVAVVRGRRAWRPALPGSWAGGVGGMGGEIAGWRSRAAFFHAVV